MEEQGFDLSGQLIDVSGLSLDELGKAFTGRPVLSEVLLTTRSPDAASGFQSNLKPPSDDAIVR